MRHLDLFSGIGGFALAARWMGWETIQFVEIDKFCQKVLNKNFPNVPIHGDIKTFNGTALRGTVDILTGGFPCQPFSVAGKQNGKEDSRYLWPEMLRVIGEIQPTVVVGENVSGSWQLVDEICSSLEVKGYTTEPIGIDAASIGAQHRRLRYWFVAYTHSSKPCTIGEDNAKVLRLQEEKRQSEYSSIVLGRDTIEAFTNIEHERRQEQRITTKFKSNPIVPSVQRGTKSGMVRRVHGIPNRVDRIKSLGNAIVPQVAFEIFKAIERIYEPEA
jgi:DNA (cytosine-5)-methyltransferase 1